jgi:hypothetical protein
MIPKMIGLTGFAGVGKDAVGDILMQSDYKKHTMGMLIKQSLLPGNPGCPSIDEIDAYVNKHAKKYALHMPSIASSYYECKLGELDPFTSNPELKAYLRPLLEIAGKTNYKWYFDKFFSSLPALCLNTRVAQIDEAWEWSRRGGIIIEVIRQGVGPASQTEDEWLFQLKKEGLIDYTFANWGSIKDSQDRFIRSLHDFLPAAYDTIPLSSWANKSNTIMTPDEYADTFKYLMTPIFSVNQACGKGQ